MRTGSRRGALCWYLPVDRENCPMVAAHGSMKGSASEEEHLAGLLRSHLHERICEISIKIICSLQL